MTRRITVRNARFQQWEALLENRSKRHHRREFLVHGVRPIEYAVELGHPLRAVLHGGSGLSSWARSILARTESVPRFELASDLLRALGERSADTETPELIAVAELPTDDLARIPSAPSDALVVVFDRPVSPGNVGTLVRSADAFGAHGVVVTGHAADPYDPKAVRASTGSVFALPIVRTGSPAEVVAWAHERGLRIVGTDEQGAVEVGACDLTGPTLLLVGNETRGLSRPWRDACDILVRLPMPGTRVASSLNAAAAGTIALYEASRQRERAG